MRKRLLVLFLVAPACRQVAPADWNAVEPLGTLAGAFDCLVIEQPDAPTVDYGVARFGGDVEHDDWMPALRTQGCVARALESERGDAISVLLLQHTDWDRAQALELVFPVDAVERGPDGAGWVDGGLLMAGASGGFGSLSHVRPERDPDVFLRVAGGTVALDEFGTAARDRVSGTFADLRVGRP